MHIKFDHNFRTPVTFCLIGSTRYKFLNIFVAFNYSSESHACMHASSVKKIAIATCYNIIMGVYIALLCI